jgi:hypothetical protein
MSGVKDSVINLVCAIYRRIYGTDLNPSLIKLHICEKTSVEYNNQVNQSESVNGLVQSIMTILQNAIQTIDITAPLIDPQALLTYIHNLLKDIDPGTENLINENTIDLYVQLARAKVNSQFEQLGVDPSTLNWDGPQEQSINNQNAV